VVALGATAARALLGRQVTIGKVRGERLEWDGPGSLLVTVHPSAVLRTADEDRSDALDAFRRDLATAAKLVREHT
jgi:DNA polymerase